MKRAMTLLLLLSASFAMAGSPPAESTDGGQVQLPLDVYTRLLEQASDPSLPPRPARVANQCRSPPARIAVESPNGRYMPTATGMMWKRTEDPRAF